MCLCATVCNEAAEVMRGGGRPLTPRDLSLRVVRFTMNDVTLV